jgi:hypothetical protein
MKAFALSLAFAIGMFPIVAAAQGEPNGGPPPDVQAKMDQARSDAKTASYNALSADHRTKVQAIVDQFDAGTISDLRDAASQIDAVLTPDETKAVLAQRQTMRDAMGGGAPGGGGPGGGFVGGGRPFSGSWAGHEHGGHQADAGRFLLTIAADPEKVRDAMREEREHSR